MKTWVNQAAAILLCMVLAFTMLAGCTGKTETGQDKTGGSSPDTTSAPSTKPAAPIRITMLNRVNPEVSFENNPIYKEIEKRTNVILEIEAPPINNFADRQKVVMASGDAPDIVHTSAGTDYDRWSEDGLLVELGDKVGNYPNIMKNISKPMWEFSRVASTGKIYAIPRPNLVGHWGMIIRQDWLEKLGLTDPQTLEEFKTVCEAFVKNDPDGNNKEDTFAFSFGYGIKGIQYISNAFNLIDNIAVPDTDGQLKLYEKKSGFYPYMEFLREAYAKKWMDNEYFLNKSYAEREKLIQNRIGMYPLHNFETGNIANIDPSAINKVSLYPPLVDSKGERKNYFTPPIWGQFSISENCKNVDEVLKFIDWCLGEEGHKLLALGVEGVHYNSYDRATGKLDRTEEQGKLLTTVTSTYCQFSLTFEGSPLVPPVPALPGMLEKYYKELDAYTKVTTNVELPFVSSVVQSTFKADNPDLLKKRDEYDIKYITGEISLEEFKKFLDEEYLPKMADVETDLIAQAKKALGQ